MKRFFAFFLAAVFAAGLFAFDVRAEEAQYYDPESGTELTLTENYFCNGCAGRKEKHRCYQDLMTGNRHGVTTEESSGV